MPPPTISTSTRPGSRRLFTGLGRGQKGLLLCVGLLLSAFNGYEVIIHILRRPFQPDFADYYVAAYIGRTAGWSHVYDFATQQALLAHFVPGWQWLPFWNPAPLAWLALPFSYLDFYPAFYLWEIPVVGAWVAAWWFLAPGTRFHRGLQLALLFALFPVGFGIWLGQPVSFVAGLLGLSWWLNRRGQPAWAGVALAAAMWIKPHPLVLVPFVLLLTGHWRWFLSFAVSAVAIGELVVISLWPAGIDQFATALHAAAMSERWADYTIAGTLGFGPLASLTRILYVALALAGAWRWRSAGPEIPVAAAVVGSLAIAPYLHLQDLALLVPAGWLAARALTGAWQARFAIAGWLSVELAVGIGRPLLVLEALWLAFLLVAPRRQVDQDAGRQESARRELEGEVVAAKPVVQVAGKEGS